MIYDGFSLYLVIVLDMLQFIFDCKVVTLLNVFFARWAVTVPIRLWMELGKVFDRGILHGLVALEKTLKALAVF